LPPSAPSTRSAEVPLILAAIELFGRDGYAAVSTRSLCEHAGTNISSIKYHFGGKDELYRAAVAYVIEQLAPRVDMVLSAFDQGRQLAGDDQILQARLIKQLIGNLLKFFLGNDDVPHFMPFVLREFFMPGPYFSSFYEAFPRRLHELFTAAVAMVEGSDPEAETTIIRAHAIIGQIMMFHIGRHVLFARLDWSEYSPERVQTISGEVQQLVLSALGLPNEQGGRDDR
jgi:AcrR family transcriptional regulator